MNVVDPSTELTLELARAAGEPSAADRLRNLEVLRARLGSPSSAASSVAPESSGAGAGTPLALVGPAASGTRGAFRHGVTSQTAQLVRLVVFGALTGALGFWLGTSTSARDAAEHAAAEHAAAERSVSEGSASEGKAAEVAAPERAGSTAAELERSAPEVASLHTDATAPPAAAVSGVAATPSPSHTSRGEPRFQSGPARTTPERAARARVALGSARTAALPSASIDPTFREAVRLLQRAQRAIDAGEPAVGMSLLDQLDARFPSDLLNEERQAARVLGWCASGETDRAFAAAQVLGVKNAGSIYGPRLARSCVALATPREKN
jgi:hypothetical protein